MKVLFLTHSFPRFPGDAPGSFILRLAVALADEGVTVHVVAPAAAGYPGSDSFGNVSVERVRYAPRQFETLAYTGNMAQDVATSWTARLAMLGYVGAHLARTMSARRRFQPDLIHAHWWFPSGVIARPVSRMSGKPLITTLHGTDVRLAKRVSASRVLFRGVLRSSSRVTTVSSWLASEVTALAPFARPEVAPMPVATERYTPGGAREPNRFLFVGRLNEQKGLAHALRALATMQRLAMLDVVGEGADGQALRRLASQLGVSDRVTWHGQLLPDALLRMYRSATALVVPSIDEGLGLVAAEAMLCETPVIAFRSGGLVDVIQHNTTGMLVEPGESADLARAMDLLLASTVHAVSLGEAGRLFAMSAFSPESAARRYATIYRQVIAERAA